MCSRRYELVNQLVDVVKGEKDFEQQTLTGIVEARAKATQVTIDASNMTPEKLKDFQEAQGQLGSSLGRLLAVSENYPNLKSNQAFSDLRAEISGSQNRVNTAILDFNGTIKEFNNKVIRFPNNIMARILGFSEKSYFPTDPETKKLPNTKF
jgi:LemA protein